MIYSFRERNHAIHEWNVQRQPCGEGGGFEDSEKVQSREGRGHAELGALLSSAIFGRLGRHRWMPGLSGALYFLSPLHLVCSPSENWQFVYCACAWSAAQAQIYDGEITAVTVPSSPQMASALVVRRALKGSHFLRGHSESWKFIVIRKKGEYVAIAYRSTPIPGEWSKVENEDTGKIPLIPIYPILFNISLWLLAQ